MKDKKYITSVHIDNVFNEAYPHLSNSIENATLQEVSRLESVKNIALENITIKEKSTIRNEFRLSLMGFIVLSILLGSFGIVSIIVYLNL